MSTKIVANCHAVHPAMSAYYRPDKFEEDSAENTKSRSVRRRMGRKRLSEDVTTSCVVRRTATHWDRPAATYVWRWQPGKRLWRRRRRRQQRRSIGSLLSAAAMAGVWLQITYVTTDEWMPRAVNELVKRIMAGGERSGELAIRGWRTAPQRQVQAVTR